MRFWRGLVLAFVFFVPSLLVAPAADASISIAIAFDALVKDSSACGVMTPVEQRAVWENGRIITYTRVHVDEPFAGDLGAGGEAWVATLGGIIGDVGQTVDGEPQLRVGVPALLFLRPDHTPGTHVVTARAQGYFSVRVDPDHTRRFRTSNAVGMLLPPSRGLAAGARLAREVVADRPADDVKRDVATVWSRLHAK